MMPAKVGKTQAEQRAATIGRWLCEKESVNKSRSYELAVGVLILWQARAGLGNILDCSRHAPQEKLYATEVEMVAPRPQRRGHVWRTRTGNSLIPFNVPCPLNISRGNIDDALG